MWRKRTFMVGATILFVCAASFLTFYYRFHFRWLLLVRNLEMKGLRSTPDYYMPEMTLPDEWIQIRIGNIEFSLPPDLAVGKINRKKHDQNYLFQHDHLSVIVSEPTQTTKLDLVMSSGANELFGEYWTLPRLKLECYRFSSCMFNWTMSPIEVRRHMFIMLMCNTVRNFNNSGEHVEYVSGADIDLVVFYKNNHAVLDWESNDKAVGGYMHFKFHGDNVDWDWVRIVSRSISVLPDIIRSGPTGQYNP